MKTELEKTDWESVKEFSLKQIKDAKISLEINQAILEKAEENLIKFPKLTAKQEDLIREPNN